MLDPLLDLRLRDLHFFDRLAVLGSLSRAAAELGLPRSTASRWLGELKGRLGVTLARRTTRAWVLTPAGEELARRGRSLLAQAESLRLALAAEAPTGVLRVSAPIPLGRLVGGAFLVALRRRLPRVRVEVRLQNQRVDLVRDGIDVAIRGGELPDSELLARRIATAGLWLYAAPELDGLSPAELPLVAAPGDEALLRRAGLAVGEVAALVDDRSAIAEAALAGVGMGLLPAFLGEPAAARGALRRRSPDPVATVPVHAVFHPSLRDDPRVQALVEVMEQQLRGAL